jgi:hypothetical protein
MSIRKPLLGALALGLGLFAAGSVSAQDTCNNVTITFKNATPDEIKVTRFEYFEQDRNDWHTEHLLGVDGFKKIEHDKSWSSTRDLGSVGGDAGTKFKATYQHHIGGTSWGPDKVVTVGPFTCTDGLDKTLVLNK